MAQSDTNQRLWSDYNQAALGAPRAQRDAMLDTGLQANTIVQACTLMIQHRVPFDHIHFDRYV